MLDRLFALENFGIKLDLENITRLCEALGHPERSFAALHVAGTNGKGSVTAMVHAALLAAGLRSARYTSPHLTTIHERFVIGRDPVDDAALVRCVEDVLALVDRLRADGTLSVLPTFFETTTAIAFELFRRAGIEAGVIEVGLGGRLDATNVLLPVVTAITTIGFDHQQHLGNTIEQIAFEKAGIIKPGVPVVTGRLPPAAFDVIRGIAAEREAPLVDSSRSAVEFEMIDGRARLTVATPVRRYGPLTLALRGEHQVANAVVAIQLLEAAEQAGLRVDRAAIETGLTTAEWPARLEVMTLEAPDGRAQRLILDAAHNPEGAAALAAYLQRWHADAPPALVIGIMRDKNVDAILDRLRPCVSAIITTVPPSPRSVPATELAARAGGGAVAIDDPLAAIDRALQLADTVCVAGSIFLAGAVREPLRQRAILR